MGYELKTFDVSETGWPYLVPNVTSAGMKARMRRAIGRAAVSVAGLTRSVGLSTGNRFVAVALPKQ